MSLFEIPPAQAQYNAERNWEDWHEAINAGGYLVNGVETNTSANAEALLGYYPLFAVRTNSVYNGSGDSTQLAAPGRSSKLSQNLRFIDNLTVDPTEGVPTEADEYDLRMEHGFNAAGDNLVMKRVSPFDGAYYECDSDAVFRFSANAQFLIANTSANLTGSAIGLNILVSQAGKNNRLVLAGHVEFAHGGDTRLGNRASIATETALKKGDRVFVTVSWIYADDPLQIVNIVWTGSKFTTAAPPTLVVN